MGGTAAMSILDQLEVWWGALLNGFDGSGVHPIHIALLTAVVYMGWVYVLRDDGASAEKRHSIAASPLPPRVSPMSPKRKKAITRGSTVVGLVGAARKPATPKRSPSKLMRGSTETVDGNMEVIEEEEDADLVERAHAARKIQSAWRRRQPPSTHNARRSSATKGTFLGPPSSSGGRGGASAGTPALLTVGRSGGSGGLDHDMLGGRRGGSEWDVFHHAHMKQKPADLRRSVINQSQTTDGNRAHRDSLPPLAPGARVSGAFAARRPPAEKSRSPRSPLSPLPERWGGVTGETVAAAGAVLGAVALSFHFLALGARVAALHTAATGLHWLADMALAADITTTAAELIVCRRVRQPVWSLVLQIISTLSVAAPAAQMMVSTVSPRWQGMIGSARAAVLPSVVMRWAGTPQTGHSELTIAVSVYAVILGGSIVVAVCLHPLTATTVGWLGAGTFCIVAGAAVLAAMRKVVHREALRRASSTVGEMGGHHHTLSARRGCIIKAFGRAIDNNVAVASAIARKFRYEFLPTGSILHMDRDTRLAVLSEGRLLGTSATGDSEITCPPSHYLGAIVTESGDPVYQT
jgi:hypothetical protein